MIDGLPISVMFDDGEFVTTNYNGYPGMFSVPALPSYIMGVKVSERSISVTISRSDFNNLLNYIRENGTSIVKTL